MNMQTFRPKGKITGPILPAFVMGRGISLPAKVLYALLCDHAQHDDYCYPSLRTLAKNLACSVTSVKKYMLELIREKLVDVRLRVSKSSHYYLLLPPEILEKCSEKASSGSVSRQAESDSPQSEIGAPRSESGYINNLVKQQEENSPLPPAQDKKPSTILGSVAAGGGDLFHDFEKAWEAYPKKEAMGLARYAWNQLRQNGLLPPLADILAAIRRFARTGSWQREHGRFIPQMSNFLRGRRWLDVPPPEEEQAAQRELEIAQADDAWKQAEAKREAERRERHARLLPVFEAFRAKFDLSDGRESMLRGTWLYLHGKYAGPTAADVPDGNTLPIHDFMKAYQRRREEENHLAARSARVQPDSRQGKPARCSEILRRPGFLERLLPRREALCATA